MVSVPSAANNQCYLIHIHAALTNDWGKPFTNRYYEKIAVLVCVCVCTYTYVHVYSNFILLLLSSKYTICRNGLADRLNYCDEIRHSNLKEQL